MSFLKKLFTTACLVTPMAAWAGCDTGYTNMYVYVTVNNNSTTPIQCESDNGGTTWLTFSSDFNELSSNQSAQGTACYADDRTDTVSGELVCYSMVNNGGVETRSQNIGTLYFEHQCSSSLHHADGGSCAYSDYVNNVNVTDAPSSDAWSSSSLMGASGTNEHALTVDYTYNQ